MPSISCYYCKQKHTAIVEVKACANAKIDAAFAAKVEIGTIVETVVPATVKKVAIPAHRAAKPAFLTTSVVTPAQKEGAKQLAEAVANIVFNPAGAAQTAQAVTVAESIAAGTAASLVKTGQDLELGMYQVTDENGAITIYKVKFNKYNTYKLAEKLVISEKYEKYDTETGTWTKSPKGKFYYAKGMMAVLTSENKMTEAQAKAFHDATKLKYGVDYGFCCVCAKLLTVKKSIDAGIGPVCAGKL